ncbi:MAG: DUF488 domain-containing protein [Acetobacteraceae bacterium]|nr:DUF488 domain-containing protein [Acetobacteraceae bacterium]
MEPATKAGSELSIASIASALPDPATFFTIGHSTRPLPELVQLLHESQVDLLADIRSVPRSRTNPQYNIETLPAALERAGIAYRHIKALGGLRGRKKGHAPSRNMLWENESFRNYADYAATSDFREGLYELLRLGREHRSALMCAEAVWWRCHRRIVADYLLAARHRVFHILGPGRTELARLTPGAQIEPDGTIVYRGTS